MTRMSNPEIGGTRPKPEPGRVEAVRTRREQIL
jgi:hypothetical protein